MLKELTSLFHTLKEVYTFMVLLAPVNVSVTG